MPGRAGPDGAAGRGRAAESDLDPLLTRQQLDYTAGVASAGWLTGRQERMWRRYRHMRTLLDLQIARDLHQDSGLSEADYDVLSTLSEKPSGSWRARDLAAQLLWSTSRLAHHVGRMEQRNLVARESCPGDARGALIGLTEPGRAALEQAAPRHVDSVRRHLISLLTADEVATLDAIASKVITHLADRGSRRLSDPGGT
jgi:DNA-binding MarR family transcriptional regulator